MIKVDHYIKTKKNEVSRYPATGYIAAGIIYMVAVTRNVGRVTRNVFQGMWGPNSGNVQFIQADGYVAAGIRYTASANYWR